MGKYFPFFFLLFPAICCAGILQERGFREALTPSPSFRQSEGEVKWDKQPESELDLGKAYYYGRGTKKNFKKARKHLQKAADAGEREAQLILALMQVQGQGIEENPQAGFEAVQKLAPDYPLAQYALARLYADGLGTPANAEKALKWLTRAAQAPVPVPAAQVQLGNYYAEGYPPYIKPDAEKAFELTLAAAEAENRTGHSQTTPDGYRVPFVVWSSDGRFKKPIEAKPFRADLLDTWMLSAAGIERPTFPARRIVHEPEGVAPQSAHLRINHGQHGPGGNGGIHGRAAPAQNSQAALRRQMMRRGNHAVPRDRIGPPRDGLVLGKLHDTLVSSDSMPGKARSQRRALFRPGK